MFVTGAVMWNSSKKKKKNDKEKAIYHYINDLSCSNIISFQKLFEELIAVDFSSGVLIIFQVWIQQLRLGGGANPAKGQRRNTAAVN